MAQTLRNRRIEMYGPEDEAPEVPDELEYEEPWITLEMDEYEPELSDWSDSE